MIWWLWSAVGLPNVHVLSMDGLWNDEAEPDVYWLGECAWTARTDNMGLGLRG